MALRLALNGKQQSFDTLTKGVSLAEMLQSLGLKEDRVAVERNGEIVGRSDWAATALNEGDRLEIVHFVGGGS